MTTDLRFQSPELITTADGSSSLYLPGLDETYHSRHGAWQESLYVYIKQGLDYLHQLGKLDQELHIFELGFGTGLNALLALQWAHAQNLKVSFHTLEPFPIPAEATHHLSYHDPDGWLPTLHASAWEQPVTISDHFTLHKQQVKLEDTDLLSGQYDIVFYDAFGPNKQAEVWSLENISKCYHALRPGGMLVTYCAQGQFRRTLVAAGFTVEKLQGPPYKKEMTRATKPA